jgi:hypothetical protein
LSISNHHEELWSPSWGGMSSQPARLTDSAYGVDGFDRIFANQRLTPSKRRVLIVANGAIGGVDFTPEERKKISAM